MANGNQGSVQQRTWVQLFFSAATARTTGWTDSIKSMFFLLLIGAIFAAIPIVTGFMTVTASSYVTAYTVSVLALMALALFNHCFAAALEGLKLKAQPPLDRDKPESHAGINFIDLVDKLSAAAMEHEKKKAANEKRKPKKFPKPKKMTIAVFTNAHSQKVISASRLFGSCALFIPTGLIDEHVKLTEQEIGALIMVELLKRRNAGARRGFFNTCAKIGLSFMQLIENCFESPYMLVRLFGYASGPLQFFLLYEKSCSRTYHFEAMKDAIEVGGEPFKKALISAYTKIGKPTYDLDKKLPPQLPLKIALSEAHQAAKAAKKAKQWKIQSVSKKYAKEFYKFCDKTVTQVGKGVTEIFSDTPAATHTREFLTALTPCTLDLKRILKGQRLEKNVLSVRESTRKQSPNELVVKIFNPAATAQPKILNCRIKIDKMPETLNEQSIKTIKQEIMAKTAAEIRTQYKLEINLYAQCKIPDELEGLSADPVSCKDNHNHNDNHRHASKPPRHASTPPSIFKDKHSKAADRREQRPKPDHHSAKNNQKRRRSL